MSYCSKSVKRIMMNCFVLIACVTGIHAQTLTGGNVLSVDGSGDYITGPTLPNFGTGDFTVEAWIKTSGGTIFSNRNTDSYGSFITFSAGAQLGVEICEDGSGTDYATPAGTASVSNNQWHHVAMTRSGTTIKFYVDGVLDNTVTTGLANIVTSEVMYVGARGGGYFGVVDYFTGTIDDLRIWSVARTAVEISANMNDYIDPGTTGLMLNYRFDESSGTTTADATSNDLDGTLHGDAAFSSTPLPVELSMFTAVSEQNSVIVKWNTATEVNNHGFEVERKNVSRFMSQVSGGNSSTLKPETSNSEWTRIVFIDGAGTSNNAHEYSYTDRSLSAGTYAFRLKQLDRDGKFTYSPEVEVTVASAPAKFELAQNYPNPFNPSTTIGFTLQVSGSTTLKIYDAIGREVATLVNENLEAGVYHQRVFDASKVSSGIYLARLQNGNSIHIKKMMLMK